MIGDFAVKKDYTARMVWGVGEHSDVFWTLSGDIFFLGTNVYHLVFLGCDPGHIFEEILKK